MLFTGRGDVLLLRESWVIGGGVFGLLFPGIRSGLRTRLILGPGLAWDWEEMLVGRGKLRRRAIARGNRSWRREGDKRLLIGNGYVLILKRWIMGYVLYVHTDCTVSIMELKS